MPAPKLTRRLFWAAEVLLLAGTVAAARMALAPRRMASARARRAAARARARRRAGSRVETSGGILSASLGRDRAGDGPARPGPGGRMRRRGDRLHSALAAPCRLAVWLNNLTAFAVPAFAGGLVVRALAGRRRTAHTASTLAQSIIFGLIVLRRVPRVPRRSTSSCSRSTCASRKVGRSRARCANCSSRCSPASSRSACSRRSSRVAYRASACRCCSPRSPVLLIFRHLTVALLRSEDRAEQLRSALQPARRRCSWACCERSCRALGMRDQTTGRHAAAVARYAKALAIELGCDEDEQDSHPHRRAAPRHRQVHVARPRPARRGHRRRGPGDRQDATPRRARCSSGALDGYGPVADAILYHHERVDGGGYPAGLIGKEIPLGSRILAICSHLRHDDRAATSYRSPMTPRGSDGRAAPSPPERPARRRAGRELHRAARA